MFDLVSRNSVTLLVELEREDDGRWIAEVLDLPGVMAYGATKGEAFKNVAALAFAVLTEQGEFADGVPGVSFVPAPEHAAHA